MGGIAETNLFIATRIYGASWITHPGVLIIALLILLGLLYPVYENWKKRRRSIEVRSATEPASPQLVEPVPMKSRIGHGLFALFFVAIFAFIVYQAKFGFGSWEPRAALFPLAIGIPCLILAILMVGFELFRSKRPVAAENVSPAEAAHETDAANLMTAPGRDEGATLGDAQLGVVRKRASAWRVRVRRE